MPVKKKKVFVGLSGGVDSAVSAALLRDEGYDVTGVFIKVWQPDFLPCLWKEERRDAMRVAAHLGIPFVFMDFEEVYKRGVADYMIEEYRKGRTPNPDVMCNKEVKFGAFWNEAKKLGADYIATGHYAQITKESPWELLEGKDKEKDQSYFLWTLKQEDLSHILFPIGHLNKSEVRALARKYKLPVAHKKDSQGICFLGHVDLEIFLSHYIKTEPGDVLDIYGKVIGRHNGSVLYTIGERHGFDVFIKSPDSRPYYIVSKDMEKNTITVSDDPDEISSWTQEFVSLKNVNWITPKEKDLLARVRYRQNKFPVGIQDNKVYFYTPQTAAPGQSLVLYKDNVCVGGGIID